MPPPPLITQHAALEHLPYANIEHLVAESAVKKQRLQRKAFLARQARHRKKMLVVELRAENQKLHQKISELERTIVQQQTVEFASSCLAVPGERAAASETEAKQPVVSNNRSLLAGRIQALSAELQRTTDALLADPVVKFVMWLMRRPRDALVRPGALFVSTICNQVLGITQAVDIERLVGALVTKSRSKDVLQAAVTFISEDIPASGLAAFEGWARQFGNVVSKIPT